MSKQQESQLWTITSPRSDYPGSAQRLLKACLRLRERHTDQLCPWPLTDLQHTELPMRLALCTLLGLFLANYPSASVPAQELQPQQKVVRLVWFPRFSPDGKSLLSAHGGWEVQEAGEVRLWNVETGKAEHVIEHPRGVRTVAWSPTGNFFVSGDFGGTLRLFDAGTAKLTKEIQPGDMIEGVRITENETRLITTHSNGDVLIFALPTLQEVHRFTAAHQENIWGMALSPDGKLLATAGKDKHVRIVDLEALKVVHELQHPNVTNGLAFSLDGKRLLTGCYDAAIRVFDVESGKQTNMLRGHDRNGVTDLQFSTAGDLLASAGFDKTVRVWDCADLDKPRLTKTLRGHDRMVFGVAISPPGDSIASAGWDDKLILWNFKDGTERWSWKR